MKGYENLLAGEENPQIIKQMLFIISMLMHSYNGKDTSDCTDILAYMITLFKDCKQCGVCSAQKKLLLYKVTEALRVFHFSFLQRYSVLLADIALSSLMYRLKTHTL